MKKRDEFISLKEQASKKELSLDDLLKEWSASHSKADPGMQDDNYCKGASSFVKFLKKKLRD